MRARPDDSRGFARRKVGAGQCLRAKARRRCRAKALNNHQAPSLANRLRRFANLGAFFLHMCAARVCRGLVTSGQEKCLRLCGLRSFFFTRCVLVSLVTAGGELLSTPSGSSSRICAREIQLLSTPFAAIACNCQMVVVKSTG